MVNMHPKSSMEVDHVMEVERVKVMNLALLVDSLLWNLENGRYRQAPIRSDTSIWVYTTADTDTDTSTLCHGASATYIIRTGRSLRERSLCYK